MLQIVDRFDSIGYDLYTRVTSVAGRNEIINEYFFISKDKKRTYKVLNDTLYLWSRTPNGRLLWIPKDEKYKKCMFILFMKEHNCLN